MKIRLGITLMVVVAALVGSATDLAFARGGRGGGGGGFGGGGGGARPAGGNFGGGGGVARPSGGFSGGGARPSVGSSPSFSRPTGGAGIGGGARPSTGMGSRPNVGAGNFGAGNFGPGNRTNIGAGAGARPSTLPTNRPGGGSGIGSGQGIGSRPGIGQGIANRPGISQQPARLPGLGTGGAGTRLPNQGAGVQDRAANRQASVADRQSDLSTRMSTGREDWQSHRQEMQGNRQDYRTSNREDWQSFANDHHGHHGDWYHGCWHGDWYPGAGWNHMWDNYPVAAALGVTVWGVNRLAYGLGYWDYSNPYAGGGDPESYDYSQPVVSYADTGAPAATTNPAAPTEPASTDAGIAALNDARMAFYEGNYTKALTLLDTTLKTMPNDTAVHEFRSLVLFALKKYPESAAAIYAVLSAGPGWDWTTMSSLYPSVEVYTKQLHALEDFTGSHPNSPDGHFLLGYHYLTMGYAPQASREFKLAQTLLPSDKLLAQLVSMTTPPDESKPSVPATPPEPPAIPAEKVLQVEKLVGTWKASTKAAQFQLELTKDGSFVWTYSRGKDKQSVKGVFAVDQNNLALEPNAGGTMLAEVEFVNPSQFTFKMIGGEAKDPGLQFKKN